MALHYKKPQSPHRKTLIAAVVSLTMLGGAATANAFSFGGIFDYATELFSKAFSTDNADIVADRLKIASSQTALAPMEIGEMQDSAAKALIVTMQADRQAHAIKDVIDGMSFGRPAGIDPETGEKIPPIVGGGLSDGLNCVALADKTLVQSKDKIKDVEIYNAHQRLAALYTSDPKAKQTNRINRHLDKYCDVSEVAAGTCTFSVDAEGSADTKYSTIYSADVLSVSGVDSALSFILNLIDPTTSTVEGCDTPICNGINAANTSYQALGNVAQGAFLGQMTDRMYYEYAGSKAGKALGAKNAIDGGMEGGGASTPTPPALPDPVVTTNPDGSVTTVTTNANGTITTSTKDKDGKVTAETKDKDGKPASATDPATPVDPTKPVDPNKPADTTKPKPADDGAGTTPSKPTDKKP